MAKVGRNSLCPCGSGIKFKKCHLNRERRVAQELRARAIRLREQEKRYGKTRPIIHGDVQNQKIVAVGDEVHWSDSWKTFPDFLFRYIKTILGSEWGNSEIAKPFDERHPIMQWYDGHCRFQASRERDKDGLFRAIPNGTSAAYLMLAYDLYILKHHGSLQKDVLRRLKQREQFQGARYELFVAATLLRAGFDLVFENEKDNTRKHPEFVAIHRVTGDRIAVEAKSRHRRGVLGFPVKREPEERLRAEVNGLLGKAVGKVKDTPLVVFIDLNLPPSPENVFEKPWFKEIADLIEAQDEENPGGHPYNMIIFSNLPHHYGLEDQPDPAKEFLVVISTKPRAPFSQIRLEEIAVAAHQYGNVPKSFPG